jgi:hypothetical protein
VHEQLAESQALAVKETAQPRGRASVLGEAMATRRSSSGSNNNDENDMGRANSTTSALLDEVLGR